MSSSNVPYESRPDNYDEIPVVSRRSEKEIKMLEFLALREEVESHYQQIREKKRKIQELLEGDASLRSVDAHLRKIPREAEEVRRARAGKRKATSEDALREQARKEEKKKVENAAKKRRREHRELLGKGYTMTVDEIEKEGGEVGVQYVYFKDLGDGKSDTKVRKGIKGLKLSSTLGEEEQVEEMEH